MGLHFTGVNLAGFVLFFCGFSSSENSMGLVNLRALSLLSPLLCSSLSWLLFITSGVAVGAMPGEVGSKPHPYLPHLPGKGLPEQKAKSLWGGRVQRHHGTCPQPAAMFEHPASVNSTPAPGYPATVTPHTFPRALVHLIGSMGCTVTIPTPHPLSPRKWEVEPPG